MGFAYILSLILLVFALVEYHSFVEYLLLYIMCMVHFVVTGCVPRGTGQSPSENGRVSTIIVCHGALAMGRSQDVTKGCRPTEFQARDVWVSTVNLCRDGADKTRLQFSHQRRNYNFWAPGRHSLLLIHNSGHFGPPLLFTVLGPWAPRHCRGCRWLVTPLFLTVGYNKENSPMFKK